MTAFNIDINAIRRLDEKQGRTPQGHEFGYLEGQGGGWFFTWFPTLDETMDSLEADPADGDGGLDRDDVEEYLRDRLPKTGRGRRLWSEGE
jgi:hypothetical protein